MLLIEENNASRYVHTSDLIIRHIKTGIRLSGLHEIINLHVQRFPADGSLFLVGNFLHWTALLSTSDYSFGFPGCEALVTPDDTSTASTTPTSLVDLSSLEPRD